SAASRLCSNKNAQLVVLQPPREGGLGEPGQIRGSRLATGDENRYHTIGCFLSTGRRILAFGDFSPYPFFLFCTWTALRRAVTAFLGTEETEEGSKRR
ncbi:MAG: hypothetical protein ABIP48_18715, partial [Planctomycetota bacterium]